MKNQKYLRTLRCFTKNKYDTGKVTKYKAQIKLIENKYIAKKPYWCSYDNQKEIESQIKELLKNGMIEQSINKTISVSGMK